MIQSGKVLFGFQLKKTREFVTFSDKCSITYHKDGSISIKIPMEDGMPVGN